jgi:hypothetical protein
MRFERANSGRFGFMRRRRRKKKRQPAELVPIQRVAPPGSVWGPMTKLGTKMQIQAALGSRAAVVELRPGLYLVGEVPESALRPEFGAIPLIGPLLVMAAGQAIGAKARRQRREQRRSEPGRGLFRWTRPEEETELSGAGCSCQRQR